MPYPISCKLLGGRRNDDEVVVVVVVVVVIRGLPLFGFGLIQVVHL